MLSSMRAIGYVRVSTDKQVDHGVSLEAQEAKIRAMAVVQGAEIVELIVDGGESAKNLNRPGMEEDLDWYLAQGRQVPAPYDPDHDIWFRYRDERDLDTWFRLLPGLLPGVLGAVRLRLG